MKLNRNKDLLGKYLKGWKCPLCNKKVFVDYSLTNKGNLQILERDCLECNTRFLMKYNNDFYSIEKIEK